MQPSFSLAHLTNRFDSVTLHAGVMLRPLMPMWIAEQLFFVRRFEVVKIVVMDPDALRHFARAGTDDQQHLAFRLLVEKLIVIDFGVVRSDFAERRTLLDANL